MQTADAVKVVVLGSSFSGKTSLLARFASDEFVECRASDTKTTVGGGFFAKSVMVGMQKIKLHMWDTAGSERFNSITRMYYRDAQAGILCYDITKHQSFAEIQFWAQQLTNHEPECRLYLCGCKLDLLGKHGEGREVTQAEAQQFADEKNAAFFETSARTGENVVALFNKICLDAVDWSFVSITTGKVTEMPRRTSIAATPAADGAKKSFNLKNKNAVHRDSGCIDGKCLLA